MLSYETEFWFHFGLSLPNKRTAEQNIAIITYWSLGLSEFSIVCIQFWYPSVSFSKRSARVHVKANWACKRKSTFMCIAEQTWMLHKFNQPIHFEDYMEM